MASDDSKPIYCICRLSYDETQFMIECDVCKDWFHGSCVGVLEHQAADIEIYHCPNCQIIHGPLGLKKRRNWHRHDYSEEGVSSKAVQTGTVIFIKELKNRHFPSADEIPVSRLHGNQLTPEYFEENGFDLPILVEKKEGLGLTVPPSNFSIQDVENCVGSMREIDVIDVAKQEDYKMLMREWTEYYNSPNRQKIFNVISLEFSNSKLSEFVSAPNIVRQMSWVSNLWPESLPDDCTYSKPEVQKYCLMGVRDSFTDYHIDFGGTSVWYHILRGEKVFYLVKPTPANLTLYENWVSSSNQSETFFGDQVDKCYKFVIKQGQTLFIPTGWIHAVFTPIDSLVFGGNFLHTLNIPLQLESYAIEKRVKTPEKYLFPNFETINWYAAKQVLDSLRDYLEDGKKPPPHLVKGGAALVMHLKSWTQRKDLNHLYIFSKDARHDVPEHIVYGKLLKDLNKEVKTSEAQKPVIPKGRGERKKKKIMPTPKQMQKIDLLHDKTQEKLLEMEEEQKKNVYNFDDEDESLDVNLLKVRIPKAGAYVDSTTSKLGSSLPSLDMKEPIVGLKLKVSNGKIVSDGSKASGDLKRGKECVGKFQPLVSSETSEGGDADSDIEDQLVVDVNPRAGKRSKSNDNPMSTSTLKPGSLKMKLSINNKLAAETSSTSTNSTSQESSGESDFRSDHNSPIKPIKLDMRALKAEKPVKTELKSAIKNNITPTENTDSKSFVKTKTELKPTVKREIGLNVKMEPKSSGKIVPKSAVKTELAPTGKTEPTSTRKTEPKSTGKTEPKSTGKSEPKSTGKSEPKSTGKLEPKSTEKPEPKSTGKPEPKSTGKTESESAGKTEPESTGKTEHSSDDEEGLTGRLTMPTIRGGLNGSIADILEASGYGTETDFKVDDEFEHAESPSMRDAIQGMLSMSRMGSMHLFSRQQESCKSATIKLKNKQRLEEDEKSLEHCYTDNEFFYPSLDFSDDEEEYVFRKGHRERDANWNPKARIYITPPQGHRPNRDNAKRENIESVLEAARLKPEVTKPKKPPVSKKKPKPEKLKLLEPVAGMSSGADSASAQQSSAFRPSLKKPLGSQGPESPTKAKKPKKGLATAKQRLGKILKIHKMGIH